MEFVIWGFGIRGKKAANFIGYQKVKAFIDSNELLVGLLYKEKRIISFEQYLREYAECFIVVSPKKNKEIIKILEDKHIDSYFKFNDCPSDVLYNEVEGIEDISFPKVDLSKVVIYGSSLYSVLLWENLQEKGFDIPLIMDKDNAKIRRMLNKISNNVYFEKDYKTSKQSIVIQTMKQTPLVEGEIVDLFELTDYVDKFHHPELHKFKAIHNGERCFIVGNGSSLSVSDLNKLASQNVICFGMNGIPLIYKNTVWRPDYYVCEDPRGMDVFGNLILESAMDNILLSDSNREFLGKIKGYNNINIFHMNSEDYMPNLPKFSENLERCAYNGRTVTYVCIQIAVYMGFREIYLLGIDFDYADGDTVQVKHFSEEYHLDKEKIIPGRRTENLLAYQAARKYADSHGINIYNATRGGKLEVFERIEFDSLFGV